MTTPTTGCLQRKHWRKAAFLNDLRFVENGEELMDYLYRREFMLMRSGPA
jgi:hypothetical protein